MLACSAAGRLVRKVRLPQTRSDDGTAQDAITMRGVLTMMIGRCVGRNDSVSAEEVTIFCGYDDRFCML